ncbi:hypothetical protein [Scytonema sp. UIC 10036]
MLAFGALGAVSRRKRK